MSDTTRTADNSADHHRPFQNPPSPEGLTDFAHSHLMRLFPPARQHPDAAELEAELRRWVVSTGLYAADEQQQLNKRQIGHLVAWCMPDAPLDVARLTIHYLAWVFVFDDTIAEDHQLLKEYLALDLPGLLRDGMTRLGTAPPCLLTSLAAVRQEIVDAGGENLLAHLASGLRQYLDACAREAPWRETGRPPTLGDYLRDRAATSGGHPLYLQRLAPGMPPCGEDLPPELIGLAEMAFLIGGLANDLLGFVYEQQHDDPVNVVTVLAHEYALPLPEAYRAAVILHATHKHRFDSDYARLITDPRLTQPQHRLAIAMNGWVGGSAAAIEPYWRALAHSQP